MKKLLFLLVLLTACTSEIIKPHACVTYYTSAQKAACSSQLSMIERKTWCQNIQSIESCQDNESCFVDQYYLFNRFNGSGSCQDQAFNYGCGDSIFAADKDNCP